MGYWEALQGDEAPMEVNRWEGWGGQAGGRRIFRRHHLHAWLSCEEDTRASGLGLRVSGGALLKLEKPQGFGLEDTGFEVK